MFVGLVDPVFRGPGIWFLVLFGIVIHHVFWTGGPGPGPLFYVVSSPFFWQYCLDQWAWYYQGPGLIFRDCWAGGLGFPGPWHFIFRICLSPQKPLPCVVPYRKPCSGIRKTEARDATYRPAKGANCFLAVLSWYIVNSQSQNLQLTGLLLFQQILFNTWPGLTLLTHPKVGNNSIFALLARCESRLVSDTSSLIESKRVKWANLLDQGSFTAFQVGKERGTSFLSFALCSFLFFLNKLLKLLALTAWFLCFQIQHCVL